ncbi:MAG: ureidoglycolate lyase [Tagaea sp.]
MDGTIQFSNFAGVDLGKMPSIARAQARVVVAPVVEASAGTLAGYGRPVRDFAEDRVTIVTWPQPGWRPIVDGTGNEGGVVEDVFEMVRRGQVQHAVNRAVGRGYVTGWFDDPADAREDRAPRDPKILYTHEANYHPDGGQIFHPRDRAPFVALLARPGDDVKPEDFVAFRFDGSFGVHIDPGVWHQPVFPLGERAVFDDRQGRVHACVACDFVSEFGAYVGVRL